jgi:hypothetical protein
MTNLENLCCSDSDESDDKELITNTTEDNTVNSLLHTTYEDTSFYSN